MQAQCPSCGSFLNFKSERSAYVVCGSCQTLVARKNLELEVVGQAAALQPDGSLLRVGTQGTYKGKSFEIVGRIQVALGPVAKPDVIWNEWFATFSDGKEGWIGEARGEYFVSFARPFPQAPSRGQVHLGQIVSLDKEQAVVTSLSEGTALGFEGELPFVTDTSYTGLFADLSTCSGRAATIDYSDHEVMIYEGQWVGFEDLKLSGLRTDAEEGEGPQLASANLVSLKCASCGAPHELRAGGISQTIVCGYCDAAMDLNGDATFREIIKFEQAMSKVPALIPLGSKGKLLGSKVEYTCIGYLARSCVVDGFKYAWFEYLLYEPTKGYRWLTESQGHWTLLMPIHQVPRNSSNKPVGYPPQTTITLGKTNYRHFQKTVATVDYVAGEFYWRVRVGEHSEVNDYVCAPQILSADAAPGEFNWSVGTYQTGAEIWKAFKLPGSPPPARGVANNQPNPHSKNTTRRWLTYLGGCAACFAMLVFQSMMGGHQFFDKNWGYKDYQPDRVQLEPIKVPPGSHNLQFDLNTSGLSNRWAYFDISLIDEKTKQIHSTSASCYHASGSDSDGAWSEAVSHDAKHMAHIKGGDYLLRIEPQSNISQVEAPEGAGEAKPFASDIFRYNLRISQDHAQWGWFWLLIMFGIVPPLWSSWRSSNFETTRWSESDHAPE